ncbi:relaxase/mobilization nuclease domain-containing protein [Burkholderia sp. IDO3]|uniref:relaxase/mobilization nuclease domain-containing protein n=1 Tax=Burkholderia sp. IDO3 TaxID=1705310 RepID=UPI000BBA9EC5|nr:relaxase/mobilization nuclease domain-containing protein [Burkholderia sp. IDO3]AXK66455.1 relaxase [Burkholderia sp. IDO3]PCD59028.1 relaxase [Burkholderia sp. IDO3]
MIVRVFNAGISRGESPINYLMGDRDHTGQPRSVAPEVMDGNPDLTVAVINGIQRKHKYVSGAIAFRDNEQPTREQMREVIQSFKQTVCPGLGSRNVNALFVLHRDKGNTEIHFVVPMTEMQTGRRMNIHPLGQQNIRLYEAFTQVTNHRLGYAQVVPDPLKLALSDFERYTADGRRDRSNKLYLHRRLTKAIRTGQIADRDQLCYFLSSEYGVEITRKGKDYLSMKFPGAEKAKRFRGPLYRADADYQQIVIQARDDRQEHRLSPTEYRQTRDTLQQLVEARRQFNVRAYLMPRVLRSERLQQRREAQLQSVFQPTITTKESAMKEKNPLQAITREQTVDSSPIKCENKPNVIRTIKMMRDQAVMGDRANMTSDFGIAGLMASLSDLESSINSAVSEMNSARSPEQKANAERKLTALMERKRRLELQLAQARQRQLNMTNGIVRLPSGLGK